MVAEQILQRLEAEFDSPPDQIRAVADLLDAGASPEFVALFRRDETGDPGEERIVGIAERLRFLSELETRKETILREAEARGLELEPLRALLQDTVDQDLLDDVDHYLRPHEHKAQAQVEKLGLGPLVEAIHGHANVDRIPQEAAARYVDATVFGLADPDEVLAQVVLALSERYGEDPALRARIRAELSRGILTATAVGAGAAPRSAAGTGSTRPPDAADTTPDDAEPAAPVTDGAPDDADAAAADETPPAGDRDGEVPVDEAPGDGAPGDDAVAPAALEVDADDGDAEATAGTSPVATDAEADEAGATGEEPTDEGESAEPDAAAEPDTTAERDAAMSDTLPRREPRQKKKGAGKPGGRHRQLVGLEEPVRRIPAGRMLALRHAEREGILQLRLVLRPGRELELFRERFSADVPPESPLGRFLDLVYGHAYDRYVHKPCEHTVRHNLKDKADRETVRTFARSLRSQLLSPVVEDAAVGSLRVAGKSAWLAVVGADGATKARHTFPIPDDAEGRAALIESLATALKEAEPAAVALPHGRREGPARRLLEEVLATFGDAPRPLVVPVDETAAVVWATSPQARRRHAQSDTGMRTTLSLARRLRDPLFELMRVEPRGLGLGQNLTEVHQGMLKRQLDAALTSCLARIGIDVNRADPALLARAPGVSKELAKAIVQDRGTNGPFQTLADLRRVPAVDDATFVRVAGFLRVRDGIDPLDAIGVPPEDRPLVERIAAKEGVAPAELIGRDLRHLDPREFVDEQYGLMRVRDTFDGLLRGPHDPRGRLEAFDNGGVARFDDLRTDQELHGRVTNLAEFGAFVDLGVGQDGLVHVSQIPGSRLRDPSRLLRVGEVVRVFVVSLDPNGRKIGLSMIKPRHLAEGRPATLGERLGGGRRRGPGGGGPGGGGPGGGPGRRREEPAPMTRAARAPDGRRGPRRGPKPPRPKDAPHMQELAADDRGRRPGRGPRGDGGPPRVITVESDKAHEAQRGHKGELRSLSGLRSLLSREDGKPGDKPDDATS